MREIVIGSRGSALALWQAHAVEGMLQERFPGLAVRIEIIHTTGDKILDTSLSRIGDKGLFTKELELALLDRRIDLAVHSLKDMATAVPEGLALSAITRRHRPEDALVAPAGTTIATLPEGGTVGSGSLRRRAQLLRLRPDLNVVDVRGNVQTRLEKYRTNGWDGMILAVAGLERLGLGDAIAQVIPPTTMLPAVGQGALGVETRDGDHEIVDLVGALDHAETHAATLAERALLRALQGGCQVPIGAYAVTDGERLEMDGMIASLDGTRLVRDRIEGNAADAERLGTELAARLAASGGEEILAEIRESAG
jgi:hydroxymethylbilane synthase